MNKQYTKKPNFHSCIAYSILFLSVLVWKLVISITLEPLQIYSQSLFQNKALSIDTLKIKAYSFTLILNEKMGRDGRDICFHFRNQQIVLNHFIPQPAIFDFDDLSREISFD